VKADDDPDALAARVLKQEHILYPTAIRMFAEGSLHMEGDVACHHGTPISSPIVLNPEQTS
ncbi:MAG: phosphoribosylglycinamide formyltransferase, partial [Gammaproteobacteria bacterium]|nr:phosphoribosylglycinamide formyltransferase [Gammaproteobacteria bacterium]